MKHVIYKEISQELLKEWQKAWEKSPVANYSNAPKWFASAIETFGYTNYAILALYEKEEMVAIGGLIKEKKYGLTFYINAPSDFVCGIPFLVDSSKTKVVQEFTRQLLHLGNIFLSNVPEDFMTILKKYTNQINVIPQSINYFLPIKKDTKGLAILNKRNKLLKQIKDCKEIITFRTFDGTTKDGLEIVFKLDQKSSKHGKGYNTFNAVLMKNFYKILARNFEKSFLVNILYLKKKPIAYEIGFLLKGNYFGSQMAYDFDYRQYSPGKIILAYVADFLASKNTIMWDLGSGENSVKQLVTEEKRNLYQIILSKNKNVRLYCSMIGKAKNYGFEQSKRHVKIYSVYRKIRNLFSK